MKDYASIVSAVKDATDAISEEELRRTVFLRLIEDALSEGHRSGAGSTPKEHTGSESKPSATPARGPAAKKRTPGKAAGGRKPYTQDRIRQEVQDMDLPAKPPDMPAFPKKAPQLIKSMWVLLAARKQTPPIDGLDPHEISYLLDKHFRKPIEFRSVNKALSNVQADGLVQRREREGGGGYLYRILDDGEERVKAYTEA